MQAAAVGCYYGDMLTPICFEYGFNSWPNLACCTFNCNATFQNLEKEKSTLVPWCNFIQNLRQYGVSCHNNDIIQIYCPALVSSFIDNPYISVFLSTSLVSDPGGHSYPIAKFFLIFQTNRCFNVVNTYHFWIFEIVLILSFSSCYWFSAKLSWSCSCSRFMITEPAPSVDEVWSSAFVKVSWTGCINDHSAIIHYVQH